MKSAKCFSVVACSIAPFLFAFSSWAADYPAPNQGDWIVTDFRFHTGEVLPELRLHYTTIGAPTGERVLILHGSTGAGTNMLNETSPANCSEQDSRSMQIATSLSCRTHSGRENHLSRPMGCAQASQNTTTTISCRRNIDWLPSI